MVLQSTCLETGSNLRLSGAVDEEVQDGVQTADDPNITVEQHVRLFNRHDVQSYNVLCDGCMVSVMVMKDDADQGAGAGWGWRGTVLSHVPHFPGYPLS